MEVFKSDKKLNQISTEESIYFSNYITMLSPAIAMPENQDINQFLSDYENLKPKVVFNFDTKK